MSERPEIECPECEGEGEVHAATPNFSSRMVPYDHLTPDDYLVRCRECDGEGVRPVTDDEWSDMSADAFSDLCESEPPPSVQERYELGWRKKQELRR